MVERLNFSNQYVGRLLGELCADGLITHERVSRSVWWRLSDGLDLVARLFDDREIGGSLL